MLCSIDRHLREKHDQLAIIWEGDEPEDVRKITYQELHKNVCRLANALKTAGVKSVSRGDVCDCELRVSDLLGSSE
jgi:acetyl-CoA synthetase